IAAAALAGFTIDAMMALRRGAGELTQTLLRLQDDLRAPVPRPRARELGEIATGLGAMGAHPADARGRGRALEARLARAQRLAARGRGVAGVAPEARTPLAGMKRPRALWAVARARAPGARAAVGGALGETARLNRLVESLLTVSRAKTLSGKEVALGALADE